MKSLLAVGVEREAKGKQEGGVRKTENKRRREGDQEGCKGAGRKLGEGGGRRSRGEHVSRDGNRGCREVARETESWGSSQHRRGPGNHISTSDPTPRGEGCSQRLHMDSLHDQPAIAEKWSCCCLHVKSTCMGWGFSAQHCAPQNVGHASLSSGATVMELGEHQLDLFIGIFTSNT